MHNYIHTCHSFTNTKWQRVTRWHANIQTYIQICTQIYIYIYIETKKYTNKNIYTDIETNIILVIKKEFTSYQIW